MIGYHCFEQYNDELSEYAEVELLVQYLSILYWKKHGNKIRIFTEEKHLSTLEKYKMAYLYDDIDITTIKQFPDNINKKRFWAIAKVLFHSIINEDEYCILDTDMFLRKMPKLDKNMSYIAAHPESHLTEQGKKVYPNLNILLTAERYEELKQFESVAPTNTSFMFFNDKELVKKWSEEAINIAIRLSKKDTTFGEMMSIEQRLLPIIASEMNKPYSTLITNSYIPGNETLGNGREWDPIPEIGGNILDVTKYYFHLWGFKKQLNNQQIYNLIVGLLAKEIKFNFPGLKDRTLRNFKILRDKKFW